MRFIFIFLPFIFLQSSAQTKGVVLKLCPLALIDDGSFPTIQAGVEFKLSERITWYNEGGIKYRNRYFDTQDSSVFKTGGFKVKTEFRYYIKNKRTGLFDGHYHAVNIFYSQDCHSSAIKYYHKSDSALILKDEFVANKKVWGINIIYGNQKKLGNRWMTDIYAGLGIRSRDINTMNKEYNKILDEMIIGRHPNLPNISQKNDADENSQVIPNLTMGIRLCYQLK